MNEVELLDQSPEHGTHPLVVELRSAADNVSYAVAVVSESGLILVQMRRVLGVPFGR